jgi:hypothetical protein
MPATYEPIATTTLGSAASSITFSSIASSWTDLRVVWCGQWNTAADRLIMRLNSDSGSNYSKTALLAGGAGPSAMSTVNANATSIVALGTSRNQNLMSMTTFDLFSYAGSTNKTVLHATSFDENGAGWLEYGVNLWRNTAAITNITLSTVNGNNFAIGTIATLYGIKNA